MNTYIYIYVYIYIYTHIDTHTYITPSQLGLFKTIAVESLQLNQIDQERKPWCRIYFAESPLSSNEGPHT